METLFSKLLDSQKLKKHHYNQDSTLPNIENNMKNEVGPLDYKITISEIETVINMAKLK